MGTNDESGDLLSDVVTAPEEAGETVETDTASADEKGNLNYDGKPDEKADASVADDQPPQKPFLDQVNEDLRKPLSKFDSFNDLGSAYLELEGKLGKSITLPGEDATEEEKASFYEKMGVPKSAKGYKLEKPPTMDDNIWDFMKRSAHAGKLSENQFRQTILTYAKMTLENAKAVTAAKKERGEQARAALKEKWGKDAPRRQEVVNRVTARFMPEKVKKVLQGYPDLATEPDFMEMLYEMGDAMGEKKLVEGNIRKSTSDVPGQLSYK